MRTHQRPSKTPSSTSATSIIAVSLWFPCAGWTIGALPLCGSERVTYLANARVYKCNEKHAEAKFSLKVGTIFEDSPIALEKWLPAVWMLCNARTAYIYEIHRALGVTQKTAWFMLHRIRLAMQTRIIREDGRAWKHSKWTKPSSAGKRRTCARPEARKDAHPKQRGG